jgi:leucyl/phenylalanyl-tRNA---protein transferase
MRLNVDRIITAYAEGWFLMADEADRLGWYRSRRRALIPLDDRFHYPRSLQRVLNQNRFTLAINQDFAGVVAGCASRPSTWISQELQALYLDLYRAGWAVSFEAWQAGNLVGGILGIVIGAAFIGESMFHAQTDASKVALVGLVEALRQGGFHLFDAQLTNPHLERFGSFLMDDTDYQGLLQQAVQESAILQLP